MSDFFTHLASRTLGHARAVRPRVLARFEPDAPAANSLEIEERESEVPPLAREERRAPSLQPGPTRSESRADGLSPAAPAPERTQPIGPAAPREIVTVAKHLPATGSESVRKTGRLLREDGSTAATVRFLRVAGEKPAEREPARERAARGRAEKAGASDVPPTIHVSIGRVEVRAIRSAEPARTPAPARTESPRLSLSAYLRGRRD